MFDAAAVVFYCGLDVEICKSLFEIFYCVFSSVLVQVAKVSC